MSIRLQGSKVVLRDIIPQDLERYYYFDYLAEDREFQNWNGPYYPVHPKTQEEHAAGLQSELDIARQNLPRNLLSLEIDGELRGVVSRYWVDEVTNWMECGIVIYDSRYWSGGYGTEAFQMWVDHVFASHEIVRLGISTWSGNERMIRLAARVGMIEEARIRKARIVNGEYYDSVKMGILREEWEALRAKR